MLRPVALPVVALTGALIAATSPRANPGLDAPSPFASEATTFMVHVENVSTGSTLALSDGGSAPAPTAPVLWVVHTEDDPVFTRGSHDRGEGLESLAEDGSPVELVGSLTGKPGIVAVGAAAVPVGEDQPGPILTGAAYHFEFDAERGQRLTLVFMFGQSNDVFFANDGDGIDLFDDGRPISVDITSRLRLWDAGTEVNQEPGAGPDQAPRQSGENTGTSEREPVRELSDVRDGFRYPQVREVVRVTIGPVS